MMTSSNGNILRVTGPLSGNSPVNSPHKGQRRGALMFSLICAWINGWVNIREAGDLRRYRAHYDVIVMSHGPKIEREWYRRPGDDAYRAYQTFFPCYLANENDKHFVTSCQMITEQCEIITQTYQQYDWKLNFTVNFLKTNNKTNPI